MAMQDVFEHTLREDILGLVRSIISFTLTTELLGSTIRTIQWSDHFGLHDALYYGTFHAVSAFCNSEVVAMDSDKARVQAIDAFSTEAIVIDGTNRESLRVLGLEQMDGVIVSTGTRISISILICLYLNEIGVKQILVKALDDDHAKILRRVGATQTGTSVAVYTYGISPSLRRPDFSRLRAAQHTT